MIVSPEPGGTKVRTVVRDVGGVLLSWMFVLVAEFVLVGAAYRSLFAGSWELIVARKVVGPIALAMLAPGSLVVVALGHLAAGSIRSARAQRALGFVAASVGVAVGIGVTEGRHFEDLALRIPFVVAVAALGFATAYVVAPRLAHLLGGRHGRTVAAVAGVALTLVFWLADARALSRLYPAFHTLLLACALASSALTVLAWRSSETPPRGELAIAFIGILLTVVSCVWAPFAARRLAHSDNLRLVLDEHAPILGRAVHVAAWLAPPPPLDMGSDAPAAPSVGEVPRALDWSGQDILLVSVDALRADHLGAYGYPRATTPNLDALAKEGAFFEHAYCPTPHTSYSVTSMMTGKAMRPLLSQGLGEESDTWATYLRRYGYKTAAFYPPAVFYIDAERFTGFEKSGLGFEYRWVEFTSAEEKVHEVERYLAKAGPEPVFMWVHLFEPHEPYVMHAEHLFGGEEQVPIDAYDSEVAYADAAIGELLKVVRAKRSKVTVVVTADHGEEFGDHGGRYHGTTCYEEQVRVPLLVSGPGVVPRRVPTVVQTIDLLPTVLSALGIPRPARVQGRDLGTVLAHAKPDDPGLAYAETDEQTMLARGDDRLLCARKIAACALYDVAKDPRELADRAPKEPRLTRELRGMTAGIERDQGRYEAAEVAWPDALRRGLQGEEDAAEDVAGLLDDANVVIRRKAAEVTFKLASPGALPHARRALATDEDYEVKRWAAVALLRMGDAPSDLAQALVNDSDKKWRRAAALAFALRGDARGKTELASWWREEGPPHESSHRRLDARDAKELLVAMARIRDTEAVPALLPSLDYVPIRPLVAETLGAIGDPRAKAPLLALFTAERYETARPCEARALVALHAGEDLRAPLAVFAGLPDPMTEAVSIARDAKLLDPHRAGVIFESPALDLESRFTVQAGVPLRVWVLAASEGGVLSGDAAGMKIDGVRTTGAVHAVDIDARPGPRGLVHGEVFLHLHETKGILAVWIVPRQAEVPSFLVPTVPDAGAHVPD